jgi:hypothetical protein
MENRLVIPETQYTNGLTFFPLLGFIPALFAKNGAQLHQLTNNIRRVAMCGSYKDSN